MDYNTSNSIELAKRARILSIKMVFRAKSSHIGSALSIVDLLACLYSNFLNVNPLEPESPKRDILILSKGHACVSLYSILALKIFFPYQDLKTYGEDGSNLMNHISHKVKGVEFSTGSLGHGLPYAVGRALASKLNGKENEIIVIVGDGELDEGSNWEAFLFASHHRLRNLTIIVDFNSLQSLTTVKETLNLEPLKDKFISFGLNVYEIDGHNHLEITNTLKRIKNDLPSVIIAKTIKGKGVSFMENSVKWHYSSPNENELKQAINEIENA
jgi:transketolase